jgi:hypothetical protein
MSTRRRLGGTNALSERVYSSDRKFARGPEEGLADKRQFIVDCPTIDCEGVFAHREKVDVGEACFSN